MPGRGGAAVAIRLADRVLSLDPPVLMGVLNVTPDSFSDGGRFLDPGAAEEHAHRMVLEGAGIIDIGGESTRPGAGEVSVDTEIDRVLPVIRRLASRLRVPVSVDTRRADVARQAIDAGAVLVNDVSGLEDDPDLGKVVAASRVGLILMHRRGGSFDMYSTARYADVVEEVRGELLHAVHRAEEVGVPRERLLVDPGIGFSKRAEHSVALLARLRDIVGMGLPVVVGPSRKSFIPRAVQFAAAGAPPDGWPTAGSRTDTPTGEPAERVGGTAAVVAIAVMAGVHVLRVHDVAIMREAALVARAIAAMGTEAPP